MRGTEIMAVSPVAGSMDTTIIESVRRLHRPGPASPPSSNTLTRSSPTIGGRVVVGVGALDVVGAVAVVVGAGKSMTIARVVVVT